MTTLCAEEYEEMQRYFTDYRDQLTEREAELFTSILEIGDKEPVPDGWAIQCREAQHRIYLKRRHDGALDEPPYIIRIQFGRDS